MWISRVEHVEDDNKRLNLLMRRLFTGERQIAERCVNVLLQIEAAIAAPLDAVAFLQKIFVFLFHHRHFLLAANGKTR